MTAEDEAAVAAHQAAASAALDNDTKGIVLVSPGGTRYRVTVTNAGALVVAAA